MRALLSYILTRILLTIPMVLILLTLVFFIIRVMPGDPVKSMLGAHAPKETMDDRHQLGWNLFSTFPRTTSSLIISALLRRFRNVALV
jgi:ABC-type dipeptide/oligopeptide/nickel transport system permease component